VDPAARSSFIAIARIVRTRGNRGEVLVELHTDFPTRFSHLERVWIEHPDGRRESLEVEKEWVHQGRQVLKFRSVDSISEAEKLSGAWVQIESDQAMPLAAGQYWDHDLVGCTVRTWARLPASCAFQETTN
jgi:16S rRNA processing protein RimM